MKDVSREWQRRMRVAPSVTCMREAAVMQTCPTTRCVLITGLSQSAGLLLSSARISSCLRLFGLLGLISFALVSVVMVCYCFVF